MTNQFNNLGDVFRHIIYDLMKTGNYNKDTYFNQMDEANDIDKNFFGNQDIREAINTLPVGNNYNKELLNNVFKVCSTRYETSYQNKLFDKINNNDDLSDSDSEYIKYNQDVLKLFLAEKKVYKTSEVQIIKEVEEKLQNIAQKSSETSEGSGSESYLGQKRSDIPINPQTQETKSFNPLESSQTQKVKEDNISSRHSDNQSRTSKTQTYKSDDILSESSEIIPEKKDFRSKLEYYSGAEKLGVTKYGTAGLVFYFIFLVIAVITVVLFVIYIIGVLIAIPFAIQIEVTRSEISGDEYSKMNAFLLSLKSFILPIQYISLTN